MLSSGMRRHIFFVRKRGIHCTWTHLREGRKWKLKKYMPCHLQKYILYLDKLVDELAKGKAMEKIKRTNK